MADSMLDDHGLVGRGDELALLQECLAALARGRGALVLIGGEAGIGKTSLAQTAGARARTAGARFAVGHCYARGLAPPFTPWHELLADLGPTGVLEAAPLPPPFGAGPPPQTAYQLMQSVASWLRAAAAARPLALLLDDLQWADQESLDLLDLVTRQLEATPLLVLATYRTDEVWPRHPIHELLPQLQRNRPACALRLRPLDTADTARLVETRHGPCDPALADYLQVRSEGNPLFLVELLDDLIRGRRLPRDEAGRWLPPPGDAPMPVLLQTLIEGRVVRLAEDSAALLEAAAVVGQEWELTVVEAVLAWPEERLLAALEEGLATRVIRPVAGAERYRFGHALIREVLYERQLARRRKGLHARVAAALEAAIGSRQPATGAPAILAYHWLAAEEWTRAARSGLAAGDAARERFAYHSAARLYAQALAAAERAALEPALLLALRERLGQTRLVLNQQEQAAADIARLLAAAREAGDRMMEGRALALLSYVQTRRYRLAEARAMGEEALRVAAAINDSPLLARCYWSLGHLDKVMGDLDQAVERTERAVQVARAAGAREVLGWSLQNLAQIAVWHGQYARGEELAAEALAVMRAQRDAIMLGGAAWVLGLARGERGRYAAACHALRAGIDHAEESGERHYLVRLLNTMGWLHGELGDTAGALRWNEQALAASRRGDTEPVTEAERYTLLNLANDELSLGRVEAAIVYLLRFQRVLDEDEYGRLRYLNRYQLLQAELCLARGEPAAALGWTEEAARLAGGKGMRKNQAKSWLLGGRALQMLARPREAAERLRRAVALADELEHGSLRWQARLWLGQAQASLRQPAAAAELYGQALGQVNAIAAALTDESLRECFLASPLVRQLRAVAADSAAASTVARPTSDYPAGLSAREVEVLRLVAQGATNMAVAEALSISVKTVNTHMTSILNKTGCANRAAAATFALRHGLA